MMFCKLALRNVSRNRRRSIVTILSIALSCAGLALFGGYVAWAHLASETHAVNITGHIQLFKKGFRAKGAGNPAAYAINNFDEIKRLLTRDKEIGPHIELVTGQLLVQGMMSYNERQTSSAFIGIGIFPEEFERMARWNPYGLFDVRALKANASLFSAGPELDSSDPEGITLGVGLGRILDIQTPPGGCERPAVELISQPPNGGMANMLTLSVRKLSARPLEEMDNRLVYLPIQQASNLLFPGEPIKATSAIILLNNIKRLPEVKNRLAVLEREGKMDLEWKDWGELNPVNVRSVQMMDMFFSFAFCIVAVVLVFTIYNTMTMTVMERVREIGTVRALGLTRENVTRMFTMEGLVLGVAGGLLGELLALAASWLINRAEILYLPPMLTIYNKLEVVVASAPGIMAGSFLGCLVVSLAGAYFPARRASRLLIAEALRR